MTYKTTFKRGKNMFKQLLIKLGILKFYTVKVRKIKPDIIKGNVDDAWLKEAYKNMEKDEPDHYRMLKRQSRQRGIK